MTRRFLLLALFPLGLAACGSDGSPTQAVPTFANPEGGLSDGGSDGGSTSDGASTNDGGSDAARSGDMVAVQLDGVPIGATARFSYVAPAGGFSHMNVWLTLIDGRTVRILILSQAEYAPPGDYPTAPATQITMFDTADLNLQSYERVEWGGRGAIKLVSSGVGGAYEGSADGTLHAQENPFAPPPPPGWKPIAFSIRWKSAPKP